VATSTVLKKDLMVFAALMLTALIWASSWIFIKVGLREIPPITLATLRFVVATPILFVIALLMGNKLNLKARDIPAIAVLGLTGVALQYILEFIALLYTTATNSSLIINTTAVFIAVLSAIFLGETFNKRKMFGVVIAFVGTFLVVADGTLSFLTANHVFGDILILFGAVTWAVYTIIGKKMIGRYSATMLTAYAFIFGTLILIPVALLELQTKPLSPISLTGWIVILFLAIPCSIFGYVVWYYALTKMEATKVAVFLYVIPLITMVLAALTLGEAITAYITVGAALIVYGIYVTERA